MPIRDVRSPVSSGVKITTGHPGPGSATRAESPGARSMSRLPPADQITPPRVRPLAKEVTQDQPATMRVHGPED